MKNVYELFISNDEITRAEWYKFYEQLNGTIGLLGKFEIRVSVKENVVRIFVLTDRDIISMSSSLEGMILKNVDEKDVPKLDESASKEATFIKFVTGGSLLDVKEQYAIKKSKSLDLISISVKTINKGKAVGKIRLQFSDGAKLNTIATKSFTSFPAHLLSFDFGGDSTYLKKKIEKYLDIEKSVHMLTSEKDNAILSVDGFPYLHGDYYLNLNSYEFDKHSFIVGASGSGKSKLISLIVDRMANSPLKDKYRVVVVDPHAALKDDVAHVPGSQIMDFGSDAVSLFSDTPHDIQAETELTTTLFKSLMSDQWNPKLERTLRFSLFTLITAKSMNLDNLKRFLTETDLRQQVVDHTKEYVPDNINRFWGSDFTEIRTQFYNEAVQPIIVLVDEMQLQPTMTGEGTASLETIINSNFLTVFSLNKVSMGEKVVKTVSGLIIQQLFLLAQGKAFDRKLIMIIDEVSVVQTPALAQILSEARKFGLTVILTQQYFGQVEKDLQNSIFTNVMNYYAFKVSEEDARLLEGNMNIELPKAIVESETEKGRKEKDTRVKLMSELHPREVLVRLANNGQIQPVIKARTVDATYAGEYQNKKEVSLEAVKKIDLPDKFVEGSNTELPDLALASSAREKVQAVQPELAGQEAPTQPKAETNPEKEPPMPIPPGSSIDTPSPETPSAASVLSGAGLAPPAEEIPEEKKKMQADIQSIFTEHSSSRFLINKKEDE